MSNTNIRNVSIKNIEELDQQSYMVFIVNKMNGGYGYYDEGEYATAIAAAAFSINSLEDSINSSSNNNLNKKFNVSYAGEKIPITRADTRKLPDSNNMPPQSHGSIYRRSSHKDHSHTGQVTDRTRSFSRYRSVDGKFDAWERSSMEKIEKRFEKLNSSISAWEKEKILKAKLEMEKKKRELELKKELNLQHYYNKLARINSAADGARTQMTEKRKNEESNVKERKKRMKSRGKVPISWFCFTC